MEKTDLEYTRVINGFFLDYYGIPHWPTHLKPWTNSVSVEGKWAVIPGDGTSRGHFITSRDMADMVARMVDLPKWNKLTSIVGEELTFLQIAEIAERVRGAYCSIINVAFRADNLKARSFALYSTAWIVLRKGRFLSRGSQKQTMACQPRNGNPPSQGSITWPG